MSAVIGTVLVPSNGPPTCGMFQLSHWLQEDIMWVSHVEWTGGHHTNTHESMSSCGNLNCIMVEDRAKYITNL